MSDIHLEFYRKPDLILPGGDILLLAGDICVAAVIDPKRTDKKSKIHMNIYDKFFKIECAKYNRVFYIMGNHEHYNGIFDNTEETLRDYLKNTNVFLLENEFVDLNDNWQLFGATLWTDYNKNDWFTTHNAKSNMSDHSVIKKFRQNELYSSYVGYFLPEDAYNIHNETVEFLDTELYEMDKIDKQTIIMTHHAPSSLSSHPKYGGPNNLLNYCFFTDLSEVILRHQNIKYWFHGHTHDVFDYMVGDDCRVMCNPHGYHGYEENSGFDINFEIEI